MTVTCFPVRCVNPICHFQKIFKSKCVGGGLNSAPLHLCTRGEEYSSRVRPKGKKKRKHSGTSANLKTVQTACFFSPPPRLLCFHSQHGGIPSFLHVCNLLIRLFPSSIPATSAQARARRGCQKLIPGRSQKETRKGIFKRVSVWYGARLACVW